MSLPLESAPASDTPDAPATPPEAVAAPGAQPHSRRDLAILLGLLGLFLAIRGAVFPFAENLYGDAVVRAELAERWAAEPKLLRSFKDVYQFGPLHTYASGIFMKLWPSREHAPRLAMLVFGVLLAIPLYRLGRRLFSPRAGMVAAASAAVWSLHIQSSTTAASEALGVTLMLFALDYLFQGIHEQRFGPLALSALFLNLACATRYDAWMYAGLFPLAVAFSGPDRIASFTRAFVLAPLLLVFPFWWMQQNELAMGDPLYPIRYIDQFHAQWVQDGIGRLGATKFRLHNLVFWPMTLVGTASLLVGVFAIAGLVRAFVRRENRALAWMALAPTAFFTFRGAVLLDFSPLARFAMVQVAIALIFVVDGFDWICGRLPRPARRGVAGLAAVLALATPLWLGWFTAWKTGMWQDVLRPVTPLSTVPVDQMAVARYLKAHAGDGGWALIDEDARYVDINVAFFTGIPDERLIRRRWENFERQLEHSQGKLWLFTLPGGTLASADALPVGEAQFTWRGRNFEKAFSAGGLYVYRER